jgi:hypothetical protein
LKCEEATESTEVVWYRGRSTRLEDESRDYSMHLLSVDSKERVILGAFSIVSKTMRGVNLPAITTGGRISFLPIGSEEDLPRLQYKFRERIEGRYPKKKYTNICIYVCAALVLTMLSNGKSPGFIFEVWGFTEPMPELEQIYYLLGQIGQNMDKNRSKVETYLGSEPIKSWVNELISFLKEEMKWNEYVSRACCGVHTQTSP